MTAKKQRPKRKRKRAVVPPPSHMNPPPQPVIPQASRRFWKVIQTKNLVGGGMFIAGFGILVGWFFSDKVHGVEKFAIVASVVLMIFGAHMLSSEPTERALKALGGAAKPLLPWGRKNGHTEEAKAQGPGGE